MPIRKTECSGTLLQIQRYRSKGCGSLRDRIDIQIEVPGLRYQELASKDAGEKFPRDSQSVERGAHGSAATIPKKPDPRCFPLNFLGVECTQLLKD
jgi:predicted ATPase with chaperone activity